jgi:selenocysteine lyase/cysteine desulfurase
VRSPGDEFAGWPRLVGADVEVPLVTGGQVRYANFDYAASTPSLVRVKDAVDALLPWYSSVHRGAGFLSGLATDAYEGAREAVRSFTNARADDCVLFTRNTTDSVNLLASALPAGTRVFAFRTEHHANLLPWRRHAAELLPVPSSPDEALELLERALRTAPAGPRLVAVTGASNATGELWPYEEIIAIAHRYGARVLMDGAQLLPHRGVDVAALDVDYLAFSGHKIYAPYGAGVLLGRPDWLRSGEPFLVGGGAVRYVTVDDVLWADLPDRQEAGSPNVLGAVALGVACATLQELGMDRVAEHESTLLRRLRTGLADVPGVRQYSLWGPGHPRNGVATFTVRGLGYAEVAAALSAEYGIGVRHGCFCAHPLMTTLLGISDDESDEIRAGLRAGEDTAVPGAVRASMGLGTTASDVDRLVEAVESVARSGLRWTYASTPDGASTWPDPDPRPRPELPFAMAAHAPAAAAASHAVPTDDRPLAPAAVPAA